MAERIKKIKVRHKTGNGSKDPHGWDIVFEYEKGEGIEDTYALSDIVKEALKRA